MSNFKWQSSLLKEGVFQDSLINDLKLNSKDFKITKGTFRYIDDAKRKDGEIYFTTKKGVFYTTLEFKRDSTFNLLSNAAQIIHYEYQASDGGNDPLLENIAGILICQSTIVFLDYIKIPNLITELYATFDKINSSAASKVYIDSSTVRDVMCKHEEELRKGCTFFHMDQHLYYKDVFDKIITELKKRLN